ncbi:uncharacterized protein [Ptychodera flava]|uniref:uncharacterized protein n=1 Tax=Ptychodera flava TaxID=63121 RepID=UPI00396A60E8
MARLQRLLWSEEYNFDDVILIEGEFIQILDSGDALRYVILGLTPKLLLIAEDNMDQSKDIDPGDLPTDDDYDLEDLELAHLYPLSVVKLSVRHSKEHELKMRMMNGETQFFEFADNVDREEKWHHWVARIHEVHVDYLGDPGKAGHILHTNEGSHHSIVHVSADVFKPKERGRSPAFKWMKHFTMTVSETHNDDIEDEATEVFTLGLPILHEAGSSSMSVRKSIRSRSAMMNEDKSDDSSVQSSDSGQTEGSDELSDVEDSGEEEKDETLKSQRLRRLVLSVGEFFGVANAEPHIHGPFVLRRTASLTALQEIKRAEESQIKTLAKNDPFNINREKITHTTSRPDILEGEATFIEDVPHLAKMTHRASLLSAELENDDPSVTPYYVNGHVMLLTNEEVALEKEVEQARQQHVDLSFSTVRKKGKYRRIMERKIKLPTIQTTDEFGHVTIQLPGEVSLKKDDENKPTSKKRFGSKLFKGRATKAFRNIGKKKDKSKPSKNTKLDKKKRSTPDDNGMSAAQENAVEEHGPIIKHVDEIDSDSLAKELTLIDRDLLIRVRDTELIDCKWTKKDKHYSAPNIMELIEFFERLVNLVATEILAHESLVKRTQTLAKFIDVRII